MARTPTTSPRPTPNLSPAGDTGTQPERGGEPDTSHAGANPAATAQNTGEPSSGNATGPAPSTTAAEMRAAENDVLDRAESTGDKTAQERPEAMEGTRDTGPAASGRRDAVGIFAGGIHDPEVLRASLPEGFGEPSRRDRELAAMGEYEPDVLAGMLLDHAGRLVRFPSGLWGMRAGTVEATSTGNASPASTITDVIVNKLIADGKVRVVETVRGQPRAVEKIEPDDNAPAEEPASSSPS